jgi:uncharacterized protein (DUF1800 family)
VCAVGFFIAMGYKKRLSSSPGASDMTSRRDVLRTLMVGAAAVSAAAPLVRGLEPPKPQTLAGPDLTDREKVIHVFNRMSFGAHAAQIDHVVKEEGYKGWVKAQLNPDSIDDAACESQVHSKFAWAGETNILDVRKAAPEYKAGQNTYHTLHQQLPQVVLTRAVESKRRFKEVMCEFWRNHFCIDTGAGDQQKSRRWTCGHYEDNVIRAHVFGRFEDMLFASAKHPAMLEYLDNQYSKKGNWNENYAREVMELHTVGADRGYGNEDVKELSRVLTGWHYNSQFKFEFYEEWHEPGSKRWLGFNLPQGYEAGEKALDFLANHRYTAEFISKKLCVYLVNDNPPASILKKATNAFIETKGNLLKVYEAILTAPEFFDRGNYRSKFKTPFQFAVSALRATDAKVEDAQATCDTLRKMGQGIYECNDPTGYFDRAESWMDAGVLTSRWDYAWRLVRNGMPGIKVPESFVQRYAKMDESKRVQAIIDEVVGGDVGDREKKTTGDTDRVLAVMLGGPSFQQR